MPGLKSKDADSAVRVVVTPSQSSYFAGESFSVTITFTNTRSPESGPPRAASHTHKRGAHSISSAPIARPPTSPGTPRTPTLNFPSRSRSGDDTSARKGLVGRNAGGPTGADKLPELLEQRRKRLLAKSLSVTIAPPEIDETLGKGNISRSASFMQRNFEDVPYISPSSPKVPSPLSRSDTLPLSSNHPHARKQSVMDGQIQLSPISVPSSPYPYTPSSSTSSFTLALDPIAETATPYPSTPATSSPSIETPSTSTFPPSSASANLNSLAHAYPPTRNIHQHPPQIGLGQPPRSTQIVPPRSAFSSTFPASNTELILYSYAQLNGTLSITPGATTTSEQTYTLNRLCSTLLRGRVVGGGSMDITSSLYNHGAPPRPPHRRSHSRSSSISSGFMSLLSPLTSSSLASSSSTPPASSASWGSAPRARTISASSAGAGKTGVGLGLAGAGAGGDEADFVDTEAPLPTFEVQPAMLAVDMALLPGESRSYTYTIKLPECLPPTFRGKSLKFSYELVVGTCRAGSSPSGGSGGANSVSRVMKVPIRVYNNVVVGRAPSPYDLLWPVTKKSSPSSTEGNGKVEEETGRILMMKRAGKSTVVPNPSRPSPTKSEGSIADLKDYAQRLLSSFPVPSEGGTVRIKLPAEAADQELSQERTLRDDWRRERERQQDQGGLSGCREAVEILTRNPRKASYDVNKDGVKVAVLTFTKSAYRLGETVLGVVELNERSSRTRVLQLSAILETQESLPSSISNSSNSRHLRRVHAEHHSSFALSTLRTTFSLDIPSDASPAFQIKLGADNGLSPTSTSSKNGGLEWKVRFCLLVAVANESSHSGTEGVRMKGLARDGPRGEWGSSWGAPAGIAPMEKPAVVPQSPYAAPQNQNTARSWASFIAASFLGSSEGGYHDGDDAEADEEDDGVYDGIKADREGGVGVGVNFGGGEDGWKEVKVETVECEIPIKVWPGNTAFKALDVVFDV